MSPHSLSHSQEKTEIDPAHRVQSRQWASFEGKVLEEREVRDMADADKNHKSRAIDQNGPTRLIFKIPFNFQRQFFNFKELV